MKLKANILCRYADGLPCFFLFLVDSKGIGHLYSYYDERIDAVIRYRQLKVWYEHIDTPLDAFIAFVCP